jgi:hypothetical protein
MDIEPLPLDWLLLRLVCLLSFMTGGYCFFECVGSKISDAVGGWLVGFGALWFTTSLEMADTHSFAPKHATCQLNQTKAHIHTQICKQQKRETINCLLKAYGSKSTFKSFIFEFEYF